MIAVRQLALPFTHEAFYNPADFLPDASNAEALTWLEAPWPAGRLALWGAAGCGKTHLLHVWAERQDARILCGPKLHGPPPLHGACGIAVDDADNAPEEPLLHLLNAASEEGLPVLLAAREAPARWATQLPDLASRLRAVPAVAVGSPGDDMLRKLFASLLAQRQLAVAEPVQRWLLLRLPREPSALRDVAARLDDQSLAAGGRVTQAIASRVLGEAAELVR